MNIHILPDDTYVDEFIVYNELFFERNGKPGGNIYIIDSPKQPCKVIYTNILWLDLTDKRNFSQLADLAQDSALIIFNGLSDQAIDFINEHSGRDWRFFWIYWGWDLYRFLNFRKVSFKTFISSYPKVKLKGCISYLRNLRKPIHYKNEFRSALVRIDYVLGNNRHEIGLLEEQYGLKIKTLNFVFKNIIDWSLVDKIKQEGVQKTDDEECVNLFLGNSATITNNHFEIIHKISRFKGHTKFKLFVPLSYGEAEYKKVLIAYGSKLLGEDFIPVTDYLSPAEYLELMNKMDIVLMNHYRSQALGNIYVFLYLGKPVFLNFKCPTSRFLDDLNVKYFDIKSFNELALRDRLMNEKEVEQNKKLIAGYTADEIYFQNLDTIYKS